MGRPRRRVSRGRKCRAATARPGCDEGPRILRARRTGDGRAAGAGRAGPDADRVGATARREEQLRAEERTFARRPTGSAAIRGAAVVGALGGNVPIGSGGVIGRGGALGIEETQREELLDERPAIGEPDDEGR